MEVSRKTDYAMRMLAELVLADGEVVSVRHAADRHNVPYSFARSIQHDLVSAGLIESVRGSHGGMRLAVDPRETSIRTVVEAVQGPIYIASCDVSGVDDGPCPFMPQCRFNPIWCEAERMLRDYFNAVTLYQAAVEGLFPTMSGGHHFDLIQAKDRADLA